jgi:hypothetical protein
LNSKGLEGGFGDESRVRAAQREPYGVFIYGSDFLNEITFAAVALVTTIGSNVSAGAAGSAGSTGSAGAGSAGATGSAGAGSTGAAGAAGSGVVGAAGWQAARTRLATNRMPIKAYKLLVLILLSS